MTTNSALAELENNADVEEAKRDLVLRFVRDQESLQTSQVELKLVDDGTIDLIDSAFTANEIAQQQNYNDEDLLKTGLSGMTLDDKGEDVSKETPLRPRPPSGRPQSRRTHRKARSEFKEKRKLSNCSRTHEAERLANSNPMSPILMDADESGIFDYRYSAEPELSSNTVLNSSWPQQVLSKKMSSGSSYRKYALCTPEHLVLEATDFENTVPQGQRPVSSQSIQRIAARVRKHSANNRITCDITQIVDSPVHSRSSSPSKSTSRRSTSRGRALINLGLEPVHPSEFSMLRAASAGKASLSGPYALMQLPPISRETPAATPPS